MKCPGQDMQYWKDDAIFEVECPKCHSTVEFYKDDTTRKCPACDHRFVNPKMDFGCASYCQFAEQCLGTLPEDFMGSREDLIKDKVAVEVKRHFHTDFKSIKKATNVARYAENLGKSEGGNLGVILCAAYLHELKQDEISSILAKVGANEKLSEEIHSLLGTGHNNSTQLDLAKNIISDALTLSTFQELVKDDNADAETLLSKTREELHTSSSKTLIEEIAV